MIAKQNIGSYPIYEFESSAELAESQLEQIQALNYNKKYDGNSGYLSIGYNLDHTIYYNENLYNFFYSCLREVQNIHFLQGELKIVDLWAVKAKFGESSGFHLHHNSIFSGVLHLTTSDSSELLLSLEDEFAKKWDFVFGSNLKRNKIEVKIKPKKGKCYIWPSFINHKVLPNTDKQNRYSIAFNTFLSVVNTEPTMSINLTLPNN